ARWSAPRAPRDASASGGGDNNGADNGPASESVAPMVLAYLRRAAGDQAGAVAAASRSTAANLYEETLYHAGDWSGFAGALAARPSPPHNSSTCSATPRPATRCSRVAPVKTRSSAAARCPPPSVRPTVRPTSPRRPGPTSAPH